MMLYQAARRLQRRYVKANGKIFLPLPPEQMTLDYFANWILSSSCVVGDVALIDGLRQSIKIPPLVVSHARIFSSNKATFLLTSDGARIENVWVSPISYLIAAWAFEGATQKMSPRRWFSAPWYVLKMGLYRKIEPWLWHVAGFSDAEPWLRVADAAAKTDHGRDERGEFGPEVTPEQLAKLNLQRLPTCGFDFELFTPPAPNGRVYEWKRFRFSDVSDSSYVLGLLKNGWRYVPPKRHKSIGRMTTDPSKKSILIDGLLLMEMDKKTHAKARLEDLEIAIGQVEAVAAIAENKDQFDYGHGRRIGQSWPRGEG